MRIYMRKEDRQLLIKKTGLSASSVSEALSFKRHSLQSRKVRCLAMNYYRGIYFE